MIADDKKNIIILSTDERVKNGSINNYILEILNSERNIDGQIVNKEVDADHDDEPFPGDYSFYYIDTEKKIVLMKDDCLSTYNFYESVDTDLYGNDITNYRKICIGELTSLDYMVFIINNNLDYKVMNIYISQLIDRLNEEKKTHAASLNRISKEGESIFMDFSFIDEEIIYTFDKKLYNEIQSKYKKILQYSTDYNFDFDVASNVYKSTHQDLNERIAFAIISTDYLNGCYWIPYFNRDKYSAGDQVLISTLDLWYEPGVIEKIIITEKPFNPVNMSYATSVVLGNVNDFLPLTVIKYHGNKMFDNIELLNALRNIFCNTSITLSNYRMDLRFLIQIIDSDVDTFDYTLINKDGGKEYYINVYTNSSYLKKEIKDNHFISIMDIIAHCKTTKSFHLLGIVVNPGVDDIHIHYDELTINLIKKIIVNNIDPLKIVIDLLNDYEIEYIGETEYEILRGYLKYDMSIDDLALKENASLEQIQYLVNKSIDKLLDIYIYNYYNRDLKRKYVDVI